MVDTTKIVKEVSKIDFEELLQKFKHLIFVGDHSLDLLSEAQREIFGKEELIKIVLNETPVGVGLQKNGRYAVFFRRKNYFLRIILEDKISKLEIITFINARNIINFKRLKNEK